MSFEQTITEFAGTPAGEILFDQFVGLITLLGVIGAQWLASKNCVFPGAGREFRPAQFVIRYVLPYVVVSFANAYKHANDEPSFGLMPLSVLGGLTGDYIAHTCGFVRHETSKKKVK